ncbi:MAG: hypothetical protein KDA91_18650, partial [Planctomycetaceae bacterium]|nr:hypothetical protein [Planctomycetaceae bacterium]
QRHDGTEFILTRSDSTSENQGGSSGLSIGVTESIGQSQTQSASRSRTQQRGRSESESFGSGTTSGGGEARGISESIGENSSYRTAPLITDGRSSTTDMTTRGNSMNRGTNISQGRNWSDSQTETTSESISSSRAVSRTVGEARSESTSHADSKTESNQKSWSNASSVTISQSPISKYTLVKQATGQLQKSLDIQDREHTRLIQQLPRQHCLVCLGQLNIAAVVRVADVHDPFEARGGTQEWKEGLVDGLKQFVYETQPYYFQREETVAAPEEAPEERDLNGPFSL